MSAKDVTPEAATSGAWGLRFAAEKQGLSLHTYDVDELARITIIHAIDHGVVPQDRWSAAIEDGKRKEAQVLKRACAAEGARDRQMVKTQEVLSRLAATDRPLAEALAADIGVLLLPDA